jgi:hypothetical protein
MASPTSSTRCTSRACGRSRAEGPWRWKRGPLKQRSCGPWPVYPLEAVARGPCIPWKLWPVARVSLGSCGPCIPQGRACGRSRAERLGAAACWSRAAAGWPARGAPRVPAPRVPAPAASPPAWASSGVDTGLLCRRWAARPSALAKPDPAIATAAAAAAIAAAAAVAAAAAGLAKRGCDGVGRRGFRCGARACSYRICARSR